MKLSLHILADWLSEQVLLSEIDKGECVYTRATMSKMDMSQPNDCLIVTTDENNPSVVLLGNHERLVLKSENVLDVYIAVVDAFIHYNRWESQLKDAVLQMRSFQEITEIAHSVLPYDILVFDWRGMILGSSDTPEVAKQRKMLDAYVFTKIQEGEICKQVAQNAIPAGFVDTEVKASVIAMNVYFPDNSFVMFYISSDNTPGKNLAHMQLALHMRSILSYMKPTKRETENLLPLYTEVQNILSGSTPNHNEIEEICKFKDWLKDEYYLLYRFEGHSNFSMKRDGLNSMLTMKLTRALVFTFNKRTYMLIPESYQKEAETVLQTTLPYFDTTAIVSLPFSDWADLPSAREQTETTLSLCSNASGKIYYCQDYVWEYIFSNVQEMCIKLNLISPDVQLLKDYDIEHDTELLKTLNIYLKCQSNMTMSAEKLYIHLNSMKYRIKKIESLISSDLKQYKDRQILLFSSEIILEKQRKM